MANAATKSINKSVRQVGLGYAAIPRCDTSDLCDFFFFLLLFLSLIGVSADLVVAFKCFADTGDDHDHGPVSGHNSCCTSAVIIYRVFHGDVHTCYKSCVTEDSEILFYLYDSLG